MGRGVVTHQSRPGARGRSHDPGILAQRSAKWFPLLPTGHSPLPRLWGTAEGGMSGRAAGSQQPDRASAFIEPS